MGVKIGSSGISDVVIGSSGGKTNIEKIVVGNADSTGTVLWERTVVPTTGGAWYGRIFGFEIMTCSWDQSMNRWHALDKDSSYYGIYFRNGCWYAEFEKIQEGNGSEKKLDNSDLDTHITWSK